MPRPLLGVLGRGQISLGHDIPELAAEVAGVVEAERLLADHRGHGCVVWTRAWA